MHPHKRSLQPLVNLMCNVAAFWLVHMMVLHECGTLVVNYCWTRSNVLVTVDSQLNVWRGFLMVLSL